MLLSRLSHFTRSAAAGAFAVLYPALAAEAGADVVISDPGALPPENISASSPTSSPNQDIVKGLIRNQVAGLLNILLATKETLDPDLQKLIPVLQDANTALKRRPAPAQQQRPRGTRGGGRQKKSASRATRIIIDLSRARACATATLTRNLGRRAAKEECITSNSDSISASGPHNWDQSRCAQIFAAFSPISRAYGAKRHRAFMAPRPVSSPAGPLRKAALPQNPGRAAESRIIAPKADFIIFARVAQRRVKCLLANDIHNNKRPSAAFPASRSAVAAQRQRAAMASRPACSSAPFSSELTPSQLILRPNRHRASVAGGYTSTLIQVLVSPLPYHCTTPQRQSPT